MIKAVIFDLDGTLIDSIEVIIKLLREVLHEFGINADADKARKLIGMSPWEIIKEVTGKATFEEQDKIVQVWAKKYMKALFTDNQVHLTKGTLEVLKELKKRGLKIGISSSLKSSIIRDLISHYGLNPYISAFTGVDEVKRPKPAPDVFISTAEKLGVSPKESIVVGDAIYDVMGGHTAGAITVLFSQEGEYNNKADIAPNYVITEIPQLIEIVDTLIT